MSFSTITKKYNHPMITKIVVKMNHATIYFGDFSKNPNGGPLEFFTRRLDTYIRYDKKAGPSYCQYRKERETLSEKPKDLESKELIIVNQHTSATESEFHEKSMFCCSPDEKKITHVHIKVNDEKQITSEQLKKITDVATAYQSDMKFDELTEEFKKKNEHERTPLIASAPAKMCGIL